MYADPVHSTDAARVGDNRRKRDGAFHLSKLHTEALREGYAAPQETLLNKKKPDAQ